MHPRTMNPAQSTFAKVRVRHRRMRGDGARRACLTTVLLVPESATRKWRTPKGANLLREGTASVCSPDGEPAEKDTSIAYAINDIGQPEAPIGIRVLVT